MSKYKKLQKKKKISTQLFYYNKFNKAIKVFKFVFNACLFSQVFHSKFGPGMINLQDSKIFFQAMH